MTQEELTYQMAWESYDRLMAVEQAILQFLSLLMEPINRTNLAKHLRDAGIMGDDGRSLSIMALGPIIDRLALLKLVATAGQAANQFYCVDAIANHATRSAVATGRLQRMAIVIQKEFPLFYGYVRKSTSFERCLRDLRIAVYSHDQQQVEKLLLVCQEQYPYVMMMNRPWTTICATPFDIEWFRELPPYIQLVALDEIVSHRLANFEDMSDVLLLLYELRHHPDAQSAGSFRRQLVAILAFLGRIEEAQTLLDSGETVAGGAALQGWIHFLRGENDEAIHVFETLVRAEKKMVDKRQIVLAKMSGVMFLLALLKSGDSEHHVRLAELLGMAHKKPLVPVTPLLHCFEATLLVQQNKVAQALTLLEKSVNQVFNLMTRQEILYVRAEEDVCLTRLFKAVARFWIDFEQARQQRQGLIFLFDQAKRNGHQWMAMEAAALIAALDPKATTHAEYAATIQRETGLHSILTIVSREEPWQRALKALVHMGATGIGKDDVKAGGNSRLVWMIKITEHAVYDIQPREQVRSANGIWSKGRPVALKLF